MKSARLSLNQLRVKSFVTSLHNTAHIKSGSNITIGDFDGSEVDESFTDSTQTISLQGFTNCTPGKLV